MEHKFRVGVGGKHTKTRTVYVSLKINVINELLKKYSEDFMEIQDIIRHVLDKELRQ